LIPFDTTQITSKTNRCQPRDGSPCHPLAAGAHAPAVAFNARQDPDSWSDRTGPLDTDGGTQAVAYGGSGRMDFETETFVCDPKRDLAPHGGSCEGRKIASPLTATDHKNPQFVAQCVTGHVTHALNTANNGKHSSKDGTGRGVPTVCTQTGQDLAPTLTTADPYAQAKDGKRQDGSRQDRLPSINQGMAVRRLTPRECERLQGFPDDFTAIPWRGKPASECPDGPRYKALGNSMAVPVVRWIGERIEAADRVLPSNGAA
jgi:DNA (cytosine-5)-methyltransferase 1